MPPRQRTPRWSTARGRPGSTAPPTPTGCGKLRAVCDERRIVLIFDEVFVGFRLALGGAKDYFGVQPDLVTYGKTLGGGLPVGVLCGRGALMKRYRADRPADICFARGTFNSHPYVMGAMQEFLHRLDEPEFQRLYQDLDRLWNARADHLNRCLQQADVPVRIANLSSIWTVCYTRPSRYNWMLQYYLRAEGLALSWVGTGRLIFSLNYTDDDFDAVDAVFPRRLPCNAAGWLVVGKGRHHQPLDQAPHPAGDADPSPRSDDAPDRHGLMQHQATRTKAREARRQSTRKATLMPQRQPENPSSSTTSASGSADNARSIRPPLNSCAGAR